MSTKDNREYMHEYYIKNKEKIREQQRPYQRIWYHEYYLKTHDKQIERSRKYYQSHKEEISRRNSKRNQKLKLRVLSHYSNGMPKCACCGESHTEFLSIDHIRGGGNQHRKEIGQLTIYHWLIKNNFPEGFQVLCFNCNHAKSFGQCPHKNQ